MSTPQRTRGRDGPSPPDETELAVPTDGEINFLWWFIQGSIMDPGTRSKLLRGFGFCERHAWIHLGIEMSFRERYLMGPAILYDALIEKALDAVGSPQTFGQRSVVRRLRAAGPCLLCVLNVRNASAGVASQRRLDRGRDDGELRKFAGELEPLWRGALCPHCAGEDDNIAKPTLCRRHLLAATAAGMSVDLAAQRHLLQDLSAHLTQYQKTFCFGGPQASDRERAALIAAIGWCSGWGALLARLRGEARRTDVEQPNSV